MPWPKGKPRKKPAEVIGAPKPKKFEVNTLQGKWLKKYLGDGITLYVSKGAKKAFQTDFRRESGKSYEIELETHPNGLVRVDEVLPVSKSQIRIIFPNWDLSGWPD